MNCLIYPFLKECKYFFEYLQEQKKEYNILHLVCPRACANKIGAEYNIENDFDIALKDVDTVIISDIAKIPWIYQDTVNKIQKCLEDGYKVICCTRLEEADLAKCQNINNNENFIYYGIIPFTDNSSLSFLNSINGIVVGIGMLSSGLDCDTTFFKLLSLFKEKGYTVAGICGRYDSRLINGCYPFPSNIFESNISNQEKIFKLNDYVNSIQMKHSADIIIICYPQGMLKFSDEIPDGFGVDSFMISQAVSVDYFILNKSLSFFNEDEFIGLNNTFRERFGFEINAIGIDNKIINFSDSKELEKIIYNKADNDEIDEEVKKCQLMNNRIVYYRVNDESSYEKIVSDCIDDLSGNVDVY